MKKPGWILETVPPMGGATGEAFVNTLQGTGMTPSAVLAREAIQNSADAWNADGTDKVKVTFRRISLIGKAKAEFIKTLGLRTTFAPRKKVLGFQHGNCLEAIAQDDVPLRLLYVEDFGTHGLYGDPHDPQSHFFRLLLSLGNGSKSRSKGNSGGSYGYGKSVYSANSRIHTIVAYSVFNPKKDSGKHYARLMGCAYLHAHEHSGVDYSGRAWFGLPSAKNEQVVEPMQDESATKMAEQLGFAIRDKSATGTSILIVDCGVDCEELRSSIEEWWWPRLLDESIGLDIRLFEENRRLEPPRPRSREHLRPFIHCFEMAIGRSLPGGKQDKTGTMQKLNAKVAPGNYGFCILDENDLDNDRLSERSGHIALIRSTRMVISYMPVGGTQPLPCVGTYVASSQVDATLRMSEPPSHDKWDPNSVRLLDLPEDDRAMVKAIIDRLKIGLRRFSYDAAPPIAKGDIRLKSLERLLGNLFKPNSTSRDPGDGHPADPIEIKFIQQPHVMADGDGLCTLGSFRISLTENANKIEAKMSVEVECLVVEDEGVSREDPISTELSTTDMAQVVEKTKSGGWIIKVDQDCNPVFQFRSSTYRSDWTTRIKVIVKETTQ